VDRRRIFYLINHNRGPVDLQLKSSWPLAHLRELRTQTHCQEPRIHLEPLDFKLMEVSSK